MRPPIWRAVVLLSSYRWLGNGVIISVEHCLQVTLFVEDLAADFVEGQEAAAAILLQHAGTEFEPLDAVDKVGKGGAMSFPSLTVYKDDLHGVFEI